MKNTYKSLLLILLFLSSCLNYEQVATLKTDGSGEMFIHFWTSYTSQSDSLIINTSGLFDTEMLKEKFTSNFTQLVETEMYKNPSDSTIHSKVKLSFTSIDSLNRLSVFDGVIFSYKFDENDDIVFEQIIKPSFTSFGLPHTESMVSYTYYIPGKILWHNANERSNNKLVWQFQSSDLSTTRTLKAIFTPFKLKETPVWVYYSSLTILIIVILYLFKRRRS